MCISGRTSQLKLRSHMTKAGFSTINGRFAMDRFNYSS